MLAKRVNFEQKITLIERTGVQFLDFGLELDRRKQSTGEFALQDSGRSLLRLQYDQHNDRYFHPAQPDVSIKPKQSIPVDESIRLLNDIWLPIPIFRQRSKNVLDSGPTTWARARMVKLSGVESGSDDCSHHLIIALDTQVFQHHEDTKYLAPIEQDISSGALFSFAYPTHTIGWFTEIGWVDDWILEVFEERSAARLRLSEADVERQKQELVHHAHYLNFLAVIGEQAQVPDITVIANQAGDQQKTPIGVDLILDVGNSRTCGILIEQHPKDDGLRWRYELELRDLTQPERVYNEPFESRVEFARAAFGKDRLARRSGRADAFLWPTIARIGTEAVNLAGKRRGTEGATGISSPKRYLWDIGKFDTGWRFNNVADRSEVEPRATAAPFSNLIDDLGEALYDLPDESAPIPVFMPYYSRSALMMFMLSEVLSQALCQINSVSQRLKMPNAGLPRQLRRIILTVPPSMPKPERELFEKRLRHALALVWKAFGWHPEDEAIDAAAFSDSSSGEPAHSAWPPFPSINIQWDEATCGQVVYLFSETQNNFGGRPEEFFQLMGRSRPSAAPKRLTIASVDIGGGTSDLVINDFVLDEGRGSNVYIIPQQRFRDGFKVAGDDILLEVLQQVLVPALMAALRARGIVDPRPLLSRLIGTDPVEVQESVLRQQLALQIMYPAGLKILKFYEAYDPVSGAETTTRTLGDLLPLHEQPSAAVLEFFADQIRREIHDDRGDFDLLGVEVALDLNRLHGLFMLEKLEISRVIRALCEIIYLYDCDILLLTGRPSRLPGIFALFRAFLPLPPDRIVKLNGYRSGTWYPFNKQGCIADPKTTAAVGAMICVLGQGRLSNFFFRANDFNPYSTVRHVGLMDDQMMIKADDVYYSDIDLDDPDYELPEQTFFEMRGRMHLGFRQLSAPRWKGSPLYELDFDDDKARDALYREGSGEVFRVYLKRERAHGKSLERFLIARVETKDGSAMRRDLLRLRLNTLTHFGINDDSYWLDSGSIFMA